MIYANAFPQTNGGLYYVPSKLGERLMLPTKYLEEMKSAPIQEVDFVATFIEVRCFPDMLITGRLKRIDV